MPTLKYDLVLAREDDLVYGLASDDDDASVNARSITGMKIEPDSEPLTYVDKIKKGTAVKMKFTLDEGLPVGSRRVVIFIDGAEVFTGEWALEP
jgi:hypothetical protein